MSERADIVRGLIERVVRMRRARWEATVVDGVVASGQALRAERLQQVVEVFELCRQAFEAIDDKTSEEARALRAMGRELWGMLAVDQEWLMDRREIKIGAPSTVGDKDLRHLWREIRHTEEANPHLKVHRGPVSLLLPPALFGKLFQAINGLLMGETRPMVTAVTSYKQGPKLQLPQDQLMAVLHVHFLVGQGKKLVAARDEVSTAIGIEPNTLERWETRRLREVLGADKMAELKDEAQRAGEYLASIDTDDEPLITSLPEGVVRWYVVMGRNEPLPSFAERFKTTHGKHQLNHE